MGDYVSSPHLFSVSSLTTSRNTLAEAKDSVDRLYALVERCYQDMSSRVQALETRELQRMHDESLTTPGDDAASIVTTIENAPRQGGTTATDGNEEPFDLAEGLRRSQVYNPTGAHQAYVAFNFTEDLQKSWVYRRNGAFRVSTCSQLTTGACSTTWSCLSDLSMAEVSNISVINLAISVDEVNNPQRSSQTWSNGNVRPEMHLQRSTATMPSQELTVPNDVVYSCKGCGEILMEGKAWEVGNLVLLKPPEY